MKTIVITGATSGLGWALALKYSQNDTLLALCGRNEERLEKLRKECVGKGAKVIIQKLDVTNRESVLEWINGISKDNVLDLVIANAGVSLGTLSHIENEYEKHNIVFETNIKGVTNTILPAIESMKKNKKGHIVIMSSVAGLGCLSGASAYAATKACVRVYGNSLKNELLPHNIKVSVVCPGFIKTPMTDANKFKMPFLVEVDKAVDIIHKGIEKEKHSIIFPKRLYLLARILHIFPVRFVQWIQRKAM